MEHVTLTTSKHEAARELARPEVKQVLSKQLDDAILYRGNLIDISSKFWDKEKTTP
jgi:spore coat protein CotF